MKSFLLVISTFLTCDLALTQSGFFNQHPGLQLQQNSNGLQYLQSVNHGSPNPLAAGQSTLPSSQNRQTLSPFSSPFSSSFFTGAPNHPNSGNLFPAAGFAGFQNPTQSNGQASQLSNPFQSPLFRSSGQQFPSFQQGFPQSFPSYTNSFSSPQQFNNPFTQFSHPNQIPQPPPIPNVPTATASHFQPQNFPNQFQFPNLAQTQSTQQSAAANHGGFNPLSLSFQVQHQPAPAAPQQHQQQPSDFSGSRTGFAAPFIPQNSAPQNFPVQQSAPAPQQALAPQQSSFSAKPAKQYNPAEVHYVNIDPKLQGDYKFGYLTGKGTGDSSFREETRLADGTVQGAYGYVDETGKQRIVRYTAGINGFKAETGDQPAPSSSVPSSRSESHQVSGHSPNQLNQNHNRLPPTQNQNSNLGPAFTSFLGQ